MNPQSKAIVGEPAPDFQCHGIVDGRIKHISLNAYTEANHWLVLVFFPKAWSFICPTEIRSFSARLEEFLYMRSCAVVFASTDSEFCLRAWNSTSELEGGLGGVHVPLISDSTHQLSANYGVLNENEGTALRALFIIDPKGTLRSMSVNDADVGRSVDEVLRLLDALAFKDEYGEGCPVDWKKGDRGIEISSKSRVEGAVEIEPRKSWTEWARPKVQRALSGNSQLSTANVMKLMTGGHTRTSSGEGQGLPTLAAFNTASENTKATSPQRPQSMFLPSLSRTSTNSRYDAQVDEVLNNAKMEREFENERAAAANRMVGTAM